MIKKYNNLSFAVGIPGILIQFYGTFVNSSVLQISGLIALIVALYFYAKAKNRHPAFCLFGMLSIIGLLVLASLKDKSGSDEVRAEKGNSKGFLIFIGILVFLGFAIPFLNSLINH